MLIFDKINYTVSHNDSTLKLQPLSFRLLETLASSPNDIISVETLIETVWGSVTVSPDTLKQRIFILRKAIEESDLSGIAYSHAWRSPNNIHADHVITSMPIAQ